tara:strand:+ start:112 stop:1251 length:1140 start_codon:yes stop_codon:yes gene_type:complete
MARKKFRTIKENLASMSKGQVKRPRLAGSELQRIYNLKEQIVTEAQKIAEDPDYVPQIKLYESDNAVQVLTEGNVATTGVLTEAQRQFSKNHAKKIAHRTFDLAVRGVFQTVADVNYDNILFDQQHSLTALLDNADSSDFKLPFAKTIMKEGSSKTAQQICAFGYDCVNNKSKKSNPEENFYIGYHANHEQEIYIYNRLDDLRLDLVPTDYKVFPTEKSRYSINGFSLFRDIFEKQKTLPWVKQLNRACNLLRECYDNSSYASVDPKKAKQINVYDLKGVAFLLNRVDELAVENEIEWSRDHLEYAIKAYWNRHSEMLKLDGEKLKALNTPRIAGLWEESVAHNYVVRAYNRFAVERGVEKLDVKRMFPNVWQALHPEG